MTVGIPKSFGSIATKALAIGKKVSPLIGAYIGFMSDPMADGRGFAGAPQFIINALNAGILKGKIANPLITAQIAVEQYPDKYPIIGGISTAVLGWALEEVGEAVSNSSVKSVGTIAKRYGGTVAVTSVIAAWLWLAGQNPNGGSMPGATAGNPVYSQNSANLPAPSIPQYDY